MKRLFFGLSVDARWPRCETGRTIDPSCRHMTLAFLGDVESEILEAHLEHIPLPNNRIGPGCATKALFTTKNVIGFEVDLGIHASTVQYHLQCLIKWLNTLGYQIGHNERTVVPHITVARRPFDMRAWQTAFAPLPIKVTGFHLYHSQPGLRYTPIWSHQLVEPWEEIEHTADCAFLVRGQSLEEIDDNAHLSLCTLHPPLLKYRSPGAAQSLDELIAKLGRLVTRGDTQEGCPLKGVVYHGEVEEREGYLEWEMIVDV